MVGLIYDRVAITFSIFSMDDRVVTDSDKKPVFTALLPSLVTTRWSIVNRKNQKSKNLFHQFAGQETVARFDGHKINTAGKVSRWQVKYL